MINATYGEACNQAEEDALIAQGCTIIVRTDLLPQAPDEPVIVYELLEETDFSSSYMAEQHSDNLNLAGDFKISLDFKLTTLNNGAHQFIMSKGTSLNNAWYIMYESIANASLGHIFVTTSSNNAVIDFNANCVVNTWYALIVERINGVTKAYLDGVEKGSTTLPMIDTNAPLYIGAWNYTPNSHRFLGSLRNVIISKG